MLNFIKEVLLFFIILIILLAVIYFDINENLIDFIIYIIVFFALSIALSEINMNEDNYSEFQEYLPDELYKKLVRCVNITTNVASFFFHCALILAIIAFLD